MKGLCRITRDEPIPEISHPNGKSYYRMLWKIERGVEKALDELDDERKLNGLEMWPIALPSQKAKEGEIKMAQANNIITYEIKRQVPIPKSSFAAKVRAIKFDPIFNQMNIGDCVELPQKVAYQFCDYVRDSKKGRAVRRKISNDMYGVWIKEKY